MFFKDGKRSSVFDPRTKFFLLIATAVFAGRCITSLPAIVCTVLIAGLLFIEGEYISAIKGVVVALIFLAVFTGTAYESGGIGGSVYYGLLMLLRYFCPIVVALMLFSKTTGMGELIASFQKMKLPMGFVIPFIVMIRFIPTVKDEWDGIRKAMMLRGIEFNLKNVLLKLGTMIEYIMAPLLFSCVSLMDELASSAMARGLDGGRVRSSYTEVKMKARDYAAIIFFTIYFVAASM